MIESNLAVKADPLPHAEACEAATCQWEGCLRRRYRLVDMLGGGRLWLCRVHAASAVKASAAARAARNAARIQRTATTQAAPSPEAVRRAVKPEPSPEAVRPPVNPEPSPAADPIHARTPEDEARGAGMEPWLIAAVLTVILVALLSLGP